MAVTLLTARGTGASSTSVALTMPAAIPANSWAYLLIITQVSSTVTPPAGWLIVDSNFTTGQFSTLLVKPVGAADSSTVVTSTIATSTRWMTGVVVASGENLDVLGNSQTTGTSGTSMNIATITPTKADCLDLVIGTLQGNSGSGAVSATPSAGFTEVLDASTAFGSASELGIYVQSKQLSGQAGTSQGTATLTTGISCRGIMWRLSLAPGTGGERIRDARQSVQVLTRSQTAKVRDARLSMQVLTKIRPGPPPFVGWGVPL